MDASAKIPAGLMRGNMNQLGDFDLCTDIATKIKIPNEQPIRMKGKYCLAQVDVVAIAPDLRLPVHLMQGRSFLRSSLRDVCIFCINLLNRKDIITFLFILAKPFYTTIYNI